MDSTSHFRCQHRHRLFTHTLAHSHRRPSNRRIWPPRRALLRYALVHLLCLLSISFASLSFFSLSRIWTSTYLQPQPPESTSFKHSLLVKRRSPIVHGRSQARCSHHTQPIHCTNHTPRNHSTLQTPQSASTNQRTPSHRLNRGDPVHTTVRPPRRTHREAALRQLDTQRVDRQWRSHRRRPPDKEKIHGSQGRSLKPND